MLYAVAVPSALMALERVDHFVDLIEASGQPDAFFDARLAPDMLDLAAQLRTTVVFALRVTLPLAGQPPEAGKFPRSIDGLRARTAHARALILALKPESFAGSENRVIAHRAGFADLEQSGGEYLSTFALPNLWFHLSAAFAILRMRGLPVGKADFDGLHSYPAGFSWEVAQPPKGQAT